MTLPAGSEKLLGQLACSLLNQGRTFSIIDLWCPLLSQSTMGGGGGGRKALADWQGYRLKPLGLGVQNPSPPPILSTFPGP